MKLPQKMQPRVGLLEDLEAMKAQHCLELEAAQAKSSRLAQALDLVSSA